MKQEQLQQVKELANFLRRPPRGIDPYSELDYNAAPINNIAISEKCENWDTIVVNGKKFRRIINTLDISKYDIRLSIDDAGDWTQPITSHELTALYNRMQVLKARSK